MFTEEMTVRDAVLSYPAASDLFKRLKIDFCCGATGRYAKPPRNGDMRQKRLSAS